MLIWLLSLLIFAFASANTVFANAYNSAGGVVIDKAASVAVANSPILIPCEDEPKLCAEPEGPGKSQDAPPGPPNGGPGPHGR